MTIRGEDIGSTRVIYGSSSSDVVLSARQDGDSKGRCHITAGGTVSFGPGGSTTPTDRFAAATGSPTVWHVNFAPASTLTTGTDTTPVAGTVYFGQLYIPVITTITGIGYLIGSVGGTDKAIVALYDSAGTLLANSALAGTTVGTTATTQEIALTAPYTANGPGLYHVSVSVNGTTCRLRLGVANGSRGGCAAGSFGTLASITPPSTNAAAPIAYTY